MGPYTVSDGKFTYEYSVDGENRERQKDALKFLKDWATAFLTLETAMLTLIAGVLIGVRELSLTLSLVESLFCWRRYRSCNLHLLRYVAITSVPGCDAANPRQ